MVLRAAYGAVLGAVRAGVLGAVYGAVGDPVCGVARAAAHA
ncbi:hypothetical protein [Kitasatospora sp. NPDC086791]